MFIIGMNEFGTELNGVGMCRECGNCTKEHSSTIDDAVDIIESSIV